MKTKYKKILMIFSIIILTAIVITIMPTRKSIKVNEWLEYRNNLGRPLICAHRGGANLNPENTEMAFDYVVNNKLADIIEIDIKLTKDEQIVIIHDNSINDLALDDNLPSLYVNDLTYEELKKYNYGRNFVDINGNTPYRDYTIDQAKNAGLSIMLLSEFLEKYESYDIKVLIEIKDKDEIAKKVADQVMNMLEGKYNSWQKDSMIISFNDEIISYITKKYPNQLTGALGYKIILEIATNILNLDSIHKAKYSSIQTSMSHDLGIIDIKCATKRFVKKVHKRNQTIAFFTIDNEEDMKYLISIGADIITTDSPHLLKKIMIEENYYEDSNN